MSKTADALQLRYSALFDNTSDHADIHASSQINPDDSYGSNFDCDLSYNMSEWRSFKRPSQVYKE
jgi:hypothetical protein